MVTNDPIGVSGRCATGVGGGDFSADVVVQTLEETLSQVHVTDGIDAVRELHRAGKLSVAVAPVVLDALQMPLIDKHDDLLAFTLVDLLEEVLVSLVNEDLLDLGEEDLS